MVSYCLKCWKNTESQNLEVKKIKYGKFMLLSRCVLCGSKISKFMKDQEASGLLSQLGIRTPLTKILLLGNIMF